MKPYAEYITTLRLAIGRRFPVASVLTACKNLRSLSLHITHRTVSFNLFTDPIIELLEEGKLVSLGIYCQDVVNGSFGDFGYWDPSYHFNVASAILITILNSEKACDALETLDFVTEPMPTGLYQLMRSKLRNLKSLSVRNSFHKGLRTGIWDHSEQPQWSLRTTLTQLSLSDCDGVEAVHIPGLVERFTSIKDLTVMACGSESSYPIQRSRGWSSSPDGLWKICEPLNTFRIEHMDEEEIMALGTIPVTTLSLVSRQIIKVMIRDPEIFPGMKVLRTFVGTIQEAPGEEHEGTTLDGLCQARGIELRRDLLNSKGCGPECMYI